MAYSDHVLPLYDKSGKLHVVMLSAELWKRSRHLIEPLIEKEEHEAQSPVRPEPLHEWEDFKTYWDFAYPLCADVQCGNCGASTTDWLEDKQKPFRLKSAQLGGLVVFHCNACGATVRKKHFKDHMCFEFSCNTKSNE